MRVDVHQHLWTEPLLSALSARRELPRVRRAGLRWRLELAGEPAGLLDVAGDDPGLRAALVHLDGLDRALVAPSCALGCEPGVVEAYAEGARDLPPAFGAWGAVALAEPDAAAAADRLLDEGFAGLCVPAGALASPERLERSAPVLERLERRGAPLLVHPGPDPWAPAGPQSGDPAWWPAMTGYVSGLHAAWHAFVGFGRRSLPPLRVVFAALAGGAPPPVERLAARGGPAERALDPLIFYETSSYGPRALDAIARVVGVDQLVHGSDRPVVAPAPAPGPLGPAAWRAMTETNPARLLG